jgi:hypothetical protein
VFEHALVGYLTAQQLHDEPAKLYFAFKQDVADEQIQPYLYFGKVIKQERQSPFSAKRLQNYTPTLVSFDSIR